MLRVENLSFSYGKIQAIRNVSFELDKGEIMAIVGANEMCIRDSCMSMPLWREDV